MRLAKVKGTCKGEVVFARLSTERMIVGLWRVYRDKECEGFTPRFFTLWRFFLAEPRKELALYANTQNEDSKLLDIGGERMLDLGDTYLARPDLEGRTSPAYDFERLPHVVESRGPESFELKLITKHGMYAYADCSFDQWLSFDLRQRRIDVSSRLRGPAAVHLD